MNSSDPRAQALTLFHKIHKSLPGLEEEPSDQTIIELLMNAINLLPEYTAEPGDKKGVILIRHIKDDPLHEVPLNIQHSVDSFKTVWKEYQNQLDKTLSKNKKGK